MAQNTKNKRTNSSNTGKNSKSNTSSRTKASGANRKKSSRSGTNARRTSKRSPVLDEVIVIIAFVITILVYLSELNLGGVIGKFVSSFLFGLTGMMAYIIPLAVFVMIAFSVMNKKNREIRIKNICAGVLLLAISMLLGLLAKPVKPEFKILDYYTYAAQSHKSGGLIGGVLSNLLSIGIGEAGAYVLLSGISLIAIMFISERLLFAGLHKRYVQYKKNRRERTVFDEDELLEDYDIVDDEDYVSATRPQVLDRPRLKLPFYNFTSESDEADDVATAKEDLKFSKKKKADSTADTEVSKDSGTAMEFKNPMYGVVPQFEVYEDELNKKFHAGDDMPSVALDDCEVTVDNPNFKPDTDFGSDLQTEADIVNVPQKEIEVQEAMPEQTTKDVENIEIVNSRSNEKMQEDLALSKKADKPKEDKKTRYKFPSLELLSKPKGKDTAISNNELNHTAQLLKSTLDSFGVSVEVKNVSCGPTVTRYELQPAQGVKVSRITSLSDDIKLSLAAADIRIEAPIPGKSAVGIEVPNATNSQVYLRTLLQSKDFSDSDKNIAFAVGKDIGGKTVVTDIAKMPHLLIAGATGSGKSVCINTLIMSILYKAHPEDVKLIMIDPKVVELSVYNGIPHLLIPVVTDPKKASAALNWAVAEMTDRYKKFAELGVREIKGYNKKVETVQDIDHKEEFKKLPQIVIIVDELADLMMVAPGEVENAICRLAQLARAAGIHLVIATQRPSVNVITGVIKANIPSRIAFAVSSAVDSRTILDSGGAEKLLGKGDMLFFPSGYPKPVRVQGAFVSDKEVMDVVDFLNTQTVESEYSKTVSEQIESAQSAVEVAGPGGEDNGRDEYYVDAAKFIIEKDKASIGMLQRSFRIGFNRAARIMDQLADAGVVGPEEGTKPRKILMTLEEFMQTLESE
ncbi:MAG: DNA translocase FtsK [Lachnospiraceae bacterium]|nr:DNA translocase FtsK [Lachnospiraceae bacterium]